MLNINNSKLVAVIAIVILTILEMGLFPTRWEQADGQDKLRTEMASQYMPKPDEQAQFQEIKQTLKEMQKDLEEVKISVARKGG